MELKLSSPVLLPRVRNMSVDPSDIAKYSIPTEFSYRFVAGLIDSIIFVLPSAIWASSMGNSGGEPGLLALVGLSPILIIPLSWWLFGTSLGLWLLSSAMIDETGRKPALWRCAWRFVERRRS